MNGRMQGELQGPGNFTGPPFIPGVIIIFCPAVKPEFNGGQSAARTLDEKGGDVSHPAAVQGRDMKFQYPGIDTRIFTHALRPTAGSIAFNSQMYFFVGRQMSDNLNKRPENRDKLARPVLFVEGKGKMRRPVRFPFGGKPCPLSCC
ncbi:MAG: hypothetical protein BWX80_04066 [Candidatus Hydrogenedentes bacterium ADurb.Bin101]|nr:MAG: hypothetical protein BWX80_04066 [Candidatus Hydrogenedentes bacterium ADurb.Bin101]